MSTVKPETRWFGGLAVLLAAVVVVVLAVWLGLHPLVAWIVGLSAITFPFYGLDKRRARSGGGRVPEIVLHLLAVAGGFLGGWAGRAVLRHKTRKREFLWVLLVSTVLWAGIAVWLLVR